METIKMEYLDWCEKFKVVCTPDGHEEWEEQDLELLRQHDSHYIWTNVSDGYYDVIQPGWHSVNRTGTWYLTEVAWEEDGVRVYVDLNYEGEPNGICENCGKSAVLYSRGVGEPSQYCSKCFDKIYFPEDVVEDEEDWLCEECGKFINNSEHEEGEGLCKECFAKKEKEEEEE